MRRGDRQGGFTYVALLFALAVFGLGAAFDVKSSAKGRAKDGTNYETW